MTTAPGSGLPSCLSTLTDRVPANAADAMARSTATPHERAVSSAERARTGLGGKATEAANGTLDPRVRDISIRHRVCGRGGAAAPTIGGQIPADPMRSFRNRLLALIIGLAALTQTVTLIAVLARTRDDVGARAEEQLRSGGSVVQQLIRFRANELGGAVAVLAADFGLHEAVASGDGATMLSAARNHAGRIGADLVLLTDAQGGVLASWPKG